MTATTARVGALSEPRAGIGGVTHLRCSAGHELTADTIRVRERWGRRVPVCGPCEDQRNGVDRPRRPSPILRVVPPVQAPGVRTARVRKVGHQWSVALLVDGQTVGPVCQHADWARAMVCATAWGEQTSRVRVRERPERVA